MPPQLTVYEVPSRMSYIKASSCAGKYWLYAEIYLEASSAIVGSAFLALTR